MQILKVIIVNGWSENASIANSVAFQPVITQFTVISRIGPTSRKVMRYFLWAIATNCLYLRSGLKNAGDNEMIIYTNHVNKSQEKFFRNTGGTTNQDRN